MSGPPSDIVHATAVAVAGSGVLFRGIAGSGKSSLALALIEDPRGAATLVADDRVNLTVRSGTIWASSPPPLRGLVEVRGVGIIQRPFLDEAAIRLIVDLLPEEECPRLPSESDRLETLLGVPLPRLRLPIGNQYAAIRVRIALSAWVR